MTYELNFVDPAVALPDFPKGSEQYVIVAVRRNHSGRVYTFAATYLSNYLLGYDEEPYEREVTGFFTAQSDGDERVNYERLLSDGDELIAWAAIPQYAAPSEAGAEETK